MSKYNFVGNVPYILKIFFDSVLIFIRFFVSIIVDIARLKKIPRKFIIKVDNCREDINNVKAYPHIQYKQ